MMHSQSVVRCTPAPRCRLTLYSLLLGGALALLMPERMDAQLSRWLMPDSVQPTGPVYNFDDAEFPVGALTIRWFTDEGDSIVGLWDFYRYMNVADWVWFPGSPGLNEEGRLRELDTMLTQAEADEHISISAAPISGVGGSISPESGHMVEVFLFDSVQAPYYWWQLLGVDTGKGELRINSHYDNLDESRIDWPWRNAGPRERLFTDPADSGLIAEHLALHYDTATDPGWTAHIDQEDAGGFLNGIFGNPSADRKLSVALKGHLDEVLDAGVADSDVIFRIELYHALASGRKYLDDSMQEVTVSSYTERLIDTFSVTKGQLYANDNDLDRLEYRDVSFTTDLRYRFGDTTLVGMMPDGYPGYWQGGSTVIEVKVYWTGKEEPSLRSIMLRNPKAQLLYSSSQGSVDFRQEIIDVARRIVHGLDGSGNVNLAAPPRQSVLRFDTGHESGEYGFGTVRALNRLLTDSLV